MVCQFTNVLPTILTWYTRNTLRSVWCINVWFHFCQKIPSSIFSFKNIPYVKSFTHSFKFIRNFSNVWHGYYIQICCHCHPSLSYIWFFFFANNLIHKFPSSLNPTLPNCPAHCDTICYLYDLNPESLLISLSLSLTHTHARARAHTHTHTHTHMGWLEL